MNTEFFINIVVVLKLIFIKSKEDKLFRFMILSVINNEEF